MTLDLDLDDRWAYGPGIQHGGFLLQTVTGATVTEQHPHPLAVTSHFLAPPSLGPAQVELETLRTGRSTSVVHAKLVQAGRTCLDVVVTAGRLGEPGAPAYNVSVPPALPPVHDCPRNGVAPGQERNGITEQLEIRMDPAAAGWLGTPSTSALVRGWLRRADGTEPDPLGLLCLADALPPVTFALGLTGWVPTVSLTVHVRALPAPGWIRAVQHATLLQDGWLDETCQLWDSTGRLVAQASQLAMYRPSPAGPP